jgi:hypothetical protein
MALTGIAQRSRFRELLPAAALLLGAAVAPAAGAVDIDVYPWIAPNASSGSPSWAAAQANAIQAMHTGSLTAGTPGTPSYFQVQYDISGADILVTSFNSWLGQVDPGTVFGPAFANEYGNRGHFALRVDGQGSQFSISQMSFVMVSTDPGNGLGYSWGAGGYNYGAGFQGVLKGTDGTLWTTDDTYVTSGPNTQLVDGLVGRGSGNAWWPCYDPACTVEERQGRMTQDAGWPGYAYTFTGTYTIGEATGSATFNITPVPEPETYAMMLAGLGLLGFMARRRKQNGAAA